MNKKIFVISDIHGFYKETILALKEKGYDENNENHLLVVCGDIFDRGEESLEIYIWLKKLTEEDKAIVIKGNHEPFFIEFLEGSYSPFNYIHNGLRSTIADFIHRTNPFESWCLIDQGCEINWTNYAKWVEEARKEILNEYPELLEWLKNLPYYFETKNYIFTHGMIDGNCLDWKNPDISWQECIWAKPEDFKNYIYNTDKNIIVGHIHCGLLRKLYGKDEKDNSTFIRPDGKIIALDSCTVVTKKVNVFVIENEILM